MFLCQNGQIEVLVESRPTLFGFVEMEEEAMEIALRRGFCW